MMLDAREIHFEADDLLAVLAASPKAAQGLGLPSPAPRAVVCAPDGGAVRFVWPSGATRSAALDAGRLGALLVGFCLRARIPMPRRSDKTLRVEADMVVLSFRTRLRPDPLTLLPEGRGGDATPIAERSWS